MAWTGGPYLYTTGRVPNPANYYLNGHAIGGSPDLYATPTTPDYAVGTKLECSDGRIWRYGYFIAAVAAARLASVDYSEASETTAIDNGVTAAAAGATEVTITSASLNQTKNAHAGSYLMIEDDAGEGYLYPIIANDAGAANAVVFYLAVPLQVALTTASDIQLVACPYANLIIGSPTDSLIKGVTMSAPSAADYGWIQTRGLAPVLCDASAGTAAIGTICTLSDGVDGAVQPLGGSATPATTDFVTEPLVGSFATTGTDTGHVVVDLRLE